MIVVKFGGTSVGDAEAIERTAEIVKGRLDDHALHSGDNVLFASVGAGMNINAFVYRMP